MIPSNLLFIAESMLGDLLVLTPAVRAVKRTFPQSRVSILIFQRRVYLRDPESRFFNESPTSGAATIFRNNPNVDDVMEVDLQSLSLLGPWSADRTWPPERTESSPTGAWLRLWVSSSSGN